MLLDSDVLIDVVRKHPPAVVWFASLVDRPGVPGFCAIEIVSGCRDAIEQKRAQQFLSSFDIVWPTEEDLDRALNEYAPLKIQSGLGVVDSLIATTAVGLNRPIATFNTKHFRAIQELQTVQPYVR